MLAGQVEPHTKLTLAEWVSHSQTTGHNPAAAVGPSVAVDFSLENLSGLEHLLHHCAGLTSLEATGNSITSLAGLFNLVYAVTSNGAAVGLTAVCMVCVFWQWLAGSSGIAQKWGWLW